jgi:putative transcriptional regulator
MKKSELVRKAAGELNGSGFATVLAGNMHTLVDVLAERRGRKLAIKAVTNIDSVTQEEAKELEKLAWFLGAEPIILGVCSKNGALKDGTSYNRFSLKCVPIDMLPKLASNQPGLVASRSLGSKIAVDGAKLSRLIKLADIGVPELSRKAKVSKSMLYRHEHGYLYASSTAVTRLESALHGSIRFEEEPYRESRQCLRQSRFANMKMQTLRLRFAPFDIVARSRNLYEVSFDANERTMAKRAELFGAIRDTFDNNYPFFVSERKSGRIRGVPVVRKQELMSQETESGLLDLLYP